MNLAAADPQSEGDVGRALSALADRDPEARTYGIRPWRLLLLEGLLFELGADPVYDLLRLTEFWASLDYPPDMPHTIQGVGNLVAPADYYTEANLVQALRRHRAWVQGEYRLLRDAAWQHRGAYPDLGTMLSRTTTGDDDMQDV